MKNLANIDTKFIDCIGTGVKYLNSVTRVSVDKLEENRGNPARCLSCDKACHVFFLATTRYVIEARSFGEMITYSSNPFFARNSLSSSSRERKKVFDVDAPEYRMLSILS